jgi:hypothetical protein
MKLYVHLGTSMTLSNPENPEATRDKAYKLVAKDNTQNQKTYTIAFEKGICALKNGQKVVSIIV